MRTTYIVSWNPDEERAECSVAGQIIAVAPGLTVMHERTVERARELWEVHGVLGEVKLKNKESGQFTASGCSTYGEDPKGTEG